MNKKLVLENGMVFEGTGFGADSDAIAELMFNTSMVGYQEIISDLSYYRQMVCMTYPIIGSYGTAAEDFESRIPEMGGLIVKDYNDKPSNFRNSKSLASTMRAYKIPGITGVDTRALTRIIRSEGSMKAVIVDIKEDTKAVVKRLKDYVMPCDHVEHVSIKEKESIRTSKALGTIVAIDCGIKWNIIRELTAKRFNIELLPSTATVEEVMACKPDGLFISNGPGNPEDCKSIIKLIQDLQGKLPIFGICLGHQIIALANKAKTYKLKFGHRGANHPVKDLETGKIEITTQNHSFAVDEESLKNTPLEVSHRNILDGTVEGLISKKDMIFSAQYHPESAAGPEDSKHLFDKFIEMIKEFKEK